MKGLLVKDLRLMKVQKNFFVFIVVIVIGMMASYDDFTFIIGFATFILSLFTISTISYDEFDNGNAFLFTLPISRSGYVVEKYCLALILGGSTWLLTLILAIACGTLRDIVFVFDIMIGAMMILPIMFVIQAMMLPFQFKFGSEKARIALFGAYGVLALIMIGVVKVAEMFSIDILGLIDSLSMINFMGLIMILIVASLLLLLISMNISIHIMKNKEF